MKRKRLKQFLCALLTVSMVAGQPLSLLAAEEAVTEVGAEGFSDAQEAVEDVDEEQVMRLVRRQKDVVVQDCAVVLFGLCEACAKKQAEG